MVWQYRTIVFEFVKDGLLGDRYIDDEDMEKTLNSQGIDGWELVSAVMVQDGVLAVLKRPGLKGRQPTSDSFIGAEQKAVGDGSQQEQPDPVTARQIQQEEKEHIRSLEQKRQEAMKQHESSQVGDIRIS